MALWPLTVFTHHENPCLWSRDSRRSTHYWPRLSHVARPRERRCLWPFPRQRWTKRRELGAMSHHALGVRTWICLSTRPRLASPRISQVLLLTLLRSVLSAMA